ncbi:MAG: hypothetical protein WAT39_08935, partial [Planctomycetota bacterium]
AAFVDVDDEVQRFLAQVRRQGEMQRRPIAVRSGEVMVRGEVPGVGANAIVYARLARQKPKDHLRAWLYHVLAAAARADGDRGWPVESRVVAKNRTDALGELPPDLAREQLAALVQGYRSGIQAPLPFFEWSSYAFGLRCHKGDDDDGALRAARAKWEPPPPEEYDAGDDVDPDIHLCWRGRDALGSDGFRQLARALWQTAHSYSREVE